MKKEETTEELIRRVTTDNKISFGKIIFSGNRGPYIVAFPDSVTADYAEMNAMDFKKLSEKEIKVDKVHIWEPGAKSPEQINALPVLDLKKYREKAVKDKEAKKAARAAKMVITKKKKAK